MCNVQGWLQGGDGGDAFPPTGMKIYAFYMVNFLRCVSFPAREYYFPLTIMRQTPPPKFSGAMPENQENEILGPTDIAYDFSLLF